MFSNHTAQGQEYLVLLQTVSTDTHLDKKHDKYVGTTLPCLLVIYARCYLWNFFLNLSSQAAPSVPGLDPYSSTTKLSSMSVWSDVRLVGFPQSSVKTSVKSSFLSTLTQTSYAVLSYSYHKNWKQYHIQWKHKIGVKQKIYQKQVLVWYVWCFNACLSLWGMHKFLCHSV